VSILSDKNTNKTEWWRGASIYQIYPRSFVDANNDGIGDLKGIISRLDYVADLGVDAIWISPFFTSPMKDFGYDVSDYRAVDPVFGSLKDFEKLTEKAHSLNLKVVIDQVYSHTSDQHEWFKNSRQSKDNRYSDWYVWKEAKEDGTPPTNWQSMFSGPAWTWDNRRKQYYLHNFLPSQPDLNFYNEEVQEALFDVAKFWVNLGVDGFRLDAINYGMYDLQLRNNPPREGVPEQIRRPVTMQKFTYSISQPGMPEFLKKYRKVLDQYGDIFTVAEVGGDEPVNVMKSYINGNDKLSSAYSFEFLAMSEPSPENLREVLGQWKDNQNDGWPSWAFSNHDVPRVLNRWAGNKPTDQQAKLYLLTLASLRGNVFLYQGEELGLEQTDVPFEQLQDPEAIANWPDNMGRDGARTPIPWHVDEPHFGFSSVMPWLPVDFHQHVKCVSEQLKNDDSVLNFAKMAFKLRQNALPLKLGTLDFEEGPSGLIVFVRQYEGKKLLCIFNTTDKNVDYSNVSNVKLLLQVGDVKADASFFPANSGGIWEVV